ncbi:DUF2019 domain-containing protein [Azorhizobium caulinodans]|uniref:DUF2019 domain-containing protein n=1 Tax=Azorhizobium caulinodans TaxID=7 RepID=UPI002FBDB6EA
MNKFTNYKTEDLVLYFVDRSMEMKRADDNMDDNAYNTADKKVRDIESELKQRPGDGRHALLPLLAHPNIQVRLNAALATLALSPEAEAALRGIAPLGSSSQPFTARRMLAALERGTYKPT